MTPDEISQIAIDLAYQGKDYDEIKIALEKQGIEPGSIKIVLQDIDQYIINYQLASQAKDRVLTYLVMGIGLFSLGIGATLYSIFSGMSQVMVWTGALLLGAYMSFNYYKEYKKPIEYFLPSNKRFNSKAKRITYP